MVGEKKALGKVCGWLFPLIKKYSWLPEGHACKNIYPHSQCGPVLCMIMLITQNLYDFRFDRAPDFSYINEWNEISTQLDIWCQKRHSRECLERLLGQFASSSEFAFWLPIFSRAPLCYWCRDFFVFIAPFFIYDLMMFQRILVLLNVLAAHEFAQLSFSEKAHNQRRHVMLRLISEQNLRRKCESVHVIVWSWTHIMSNYS